MEGVPASPAIDNNFISILTAGRGNAKALDSFGVPTRKGWHVYEGAGDVSPFRFSDKLMLESHSIENSSTRT